MICIDGVILLSYMCLTSTHMFLHIYKAKNTARPDNKNLWNNSQLACWEQGAVAPVHVTFSTCLCLVNARVANKAKKFHKVVFAWNSHHQ